MERVTGTLGLVCGLDGNLKKLGVFSVKERETLAANLQREAICSSVQIETFSVKKLL